MTLKFQPDIIENDGFPVESHEVQTGDGYVLKMFRIPYSPNLQNQNTTKKVAFLMHGILSSSDCWIMNGAENSLAYVLSNAGYDVWMGNARGNTYSRNNVEMTSLLPHFWDFSWNEIAVFDLPAMFDYIRYVTGEQSFHYVGHSQGTTVYMALLASLPSFNEYIETGQLLSPIGFMRDLSSPLAKVAGPLLGKPNIFSRLFGSNEFLPSLDLYGLFGEAACRHKSPLQICSNILFLIAGYDSEYLNYVSMNI